MEPLNFTITKDSPFSSLTSYIYTKYSNSFPKYPLWLKWPKMGSPPKAHAETTWIRLARVYLAAPDSVVRPARVPYVGPVRCSGPLLQLAASKET